MLDKGEEKRGFQKLPGGGGGGLGALQLVAEFPAEEKLVYKCILLSEHYLNQFLQV